MAPALRIPIVLSSIRSGRLSERVATLVQRRALAAGHDAPLVDLRALAISHYDETDGFRDHPGASALLAELAQSDGVAWVVPEYNHGYPGALKDALDLVRRELERKPSAVFGVSRGPGGGIRAIEQLRLVLIELRGVPIRGSVAFASARSAVSEEGSPTDPDSDLVSRVDHALAELAWYAAALRWGRDNLAAPTR